MAISSSIIIEDSAQPDGRRWIRERHTDHLGATHDVVYMAESATNASEVMSNRVASILSQLKQAEINANMAKALNGELTFIFNHSTVAENRTVLRELFMVSTKWELTTLAWVIHELSLSDTQLKNLFGVNDAQLPALKTKLLNQHDRYEDILAEVAQ